MIFTLNNFWISKIGCTINNLEDTKELLAKHYQKKKTADQNTKDEINNNYKRINELIAFLQQIDT